MKTDEELAKKKGVLLHVMTDTLIMDISTGRLMGKLDPVDQITRFSLAEMLVFCQRVVDKLAKHEAP
jgi:hypothetical protein